MTDPVEDTVPSHEQTEEEELVVLFESAQECIVPLDSAEARIGLAPHDQARIRELTNCVAEQNKLIKKLLDITIVMNNVYATK